MNDVIILAAGSGKRCNLGYNKLLHKINGRMILEYTMDKFKDYNIILTVSEDDYDIFVEKFKDCKIVIGGATRQQSVVNAMKLCTSESVLIHDGARMFVSSQVIENVAKASVLSDAVVPCVKVKDSIKDEHGRNIERSNLHIAQTPQAVKRGLYLQCVAEECTDDVSVLEKCGHDVCIVEGSYDNVKITTIEDIEFAKLKIGG